MESRKIACALMIAAVLLPHGAYAQPSDVTYVYDALSRVTSATYGSGAAVTYSYDAAGNRTQITSTPDALAPSIPTGLSGTAPSPTRINLSWAASTDSGSAGLAGYRIYRGGSQIGTSATASYSDLTVAASTTYSYTVAAYDNAGNTSTRSSAVSVTTPAPPDTTAPSIPTGVSGTAASPTRINLSWTASTDTGGAGLAGYKIYRGGAQIGTSAATSYSDLTVAASTAYSYTVAAYDNAGNSSAQSSAVSVTTPAPPDTAAPSIPMGLGGTAASGTQINLSWTAATDTGGSGLAGYKIYRGGTQIGSTATTSYSDATIAPNTTYSYAVAAYDNASNTSAQSGAISVTTPDPYLQITDDAGNVISAAAALYTSVVDCSGGRGCTYRLKQAYGALTEVWAIRAISQPVCTSAYNARTTAGYRRPSSTSCRIEALTSVYGR